MLRFGEKTLLLHPFTAWSRLRLFVITFSLLLFFQASRAENIIVTNTSDNPSLPNTLRDAIKRASSGDFIVFDSTLSGQKILLQDELNIVGLNVAIDGSDLTSGITISGAKTHRVFNIYGQSDVTLNSLTISDGNDDIGGAGGGILTSNSNLRIENCTLSHNSAFTGGAIHFTDGKLTITNSTLAQNTATTGGGAIAQNGGTLSISHSTIANNKALSNGSGGGLLLSNGIEFNLESSIITENFIHRELGGLEIKSDIKISNSQTLTLTLNNKNFVCNLESDSGQIVSKKILTGEAGLGALGDYGGLTFTIPLLVGSPAIDAGGTTTLSLLNLDQRGFPRGLGNGIDLGAYEAGSGNYSGDNLSLFAFNPNPTNNYTFEISTDPKFNITTTNLDFNSSMGDGSDSQFKYPASVAQDSEGNIFIADTGNHRVCMVKPDGTMTTIAGSNYGFRDGTATSAAMKFPSALAVCPRSQDIYITDTYNHSIRKLTRPQEGNPWTLSTIAGTGRRGNQDGQGFDAEFYLPQGITIDATGTNIYVSDTQNNLIRKIEASSGKTTTFVDDGILSNPTGLALDHTGILIVADSGNNVIRYFSLQNKLQHGILAGVLGVSGYRDTAPPVDPVEANFDNPSGIFLDGTTLYVADEGNHVIRKMALTWDPDIGHSNVTTVIGIGTQEGDINGNATQATFAGPRSIIIESDSKNIFVADTLNDRIRKVVANNTQVDATVDSSGIISAELEVSRLSLVEEVPYYSRLRTQDGSWHQPLGQRFIIPRSPTVTAVETDNLSQTGVTFTASVNPHDSPTNVQFEYSTDPSMRGPLSVETIRKDDPQPISPSGVAVANDGTIFLADRKGHKIQIYHPDGTRSSVGNGTPGFQDGPANLAQFDHPSGLALDESKNEEILYVADEFNHCIRRINLDNKVVSTYAGSGKAGFVDGSGLNGRFLYPAGVAVDNNGKVYVADSGNHRIRKIEALRNEMQISTVAGDGNAGRVDGPSQNSRFKLPRALVVTKSGQIYVADSGNHCVRSIVNGSVSTSAGSSGSAGFLDASSEQALFNNPTGIAFFEDNLYVTDSNNHRIRKLSLGIGEVSTMAGSGQAALIDSVITELYPATTTAFRKHSSITIDSAGTLYISDSENRALRKIDRLAVPTEEVALSIDGNINQDVSATASLNLLPGATYYFRAIASNGRNTRTASEIKNFILPKSQIVVRNTSTPDSPPVTEGDVIDLGSTPLGTHSSKPFTIKNIGNYALELDTINIETTSKDDVISNIELFEALGILQKTLAPNKEFTFEVNVQHPQQLDSNETFQQTITISSDDFEKGTFKFNVTRQVLAPPSLTNLIHRDINASEVSLVTQVNTAGNATDVAFEFSTNEDFGGSLKILTKAGSGSSGFANGCGETTKFNTPTDVASDRNGNLYVADTMNHRIRKISSDGVCGVLAGSGNAGFKDGLGVAAQFNSPRGIAVDPNGNVYVADTMNHRIRMISPEGQVTTVAGTGSAAFTDGIAAAARFNEPTKIAVDSAGTLFIIDKMNQCVRMINTLSFEVSTIDELTSFSLLRDVVVDNEGSLYVATSTNVIKWQTGPAGTNEVKYNLISAGILKNCGGLALDSDGQILVTDEHLVAKISNTSTDGLELFEILAGLEGVDGAADGDGTSARFNNPSGITVNPTGTIFVADTGGHRIRQINLAAKTIVAARNLSGDNPIEVAIKIEGLEPNTTYYYRAKATNGGGARKNEGGAQTFTTSDNEATLSSLLVNGEPLDGFDPCVYRYQARVPSFGELILTATTASNGASIALIKNGALCCQLQSGTQSEPIPLLPGPNNLKIEVTSADGTELRSYSFSVERNGTSYLQWQAENFQDNTANTTSGATADPSGDGIVNLLKYAFGLDPNQYSLEGLPVISESSEGLTVTYNKLISASDLTYRVEWSTNLQDWSSTGVTEVTLETGSETEQVRATLPNSSATQVFARVGLSLDQP